MIIYIYMYTMAVIFSYFFFLLFSQGEMYKLFWSDQPEFVRMAARFGATIVPFGVVGEDDLAEVSTHFSSFLFFSIILID